MAGRLTAAAHRVAADSTTRQKVSGRAAGAAGCMLTPGVGVQGLMGSGRRRPRRTCWQAGSCTVRRGVVDMCFRRSSTRGGSVSAVSAFTCMWRVVGRVFHKRDGSSVLSVRRILMSTAEDVIGYSTRCSGGKSS